ncbi:MAG: RagB/SusD family nutrient uptake outer membrane protein [Flavisolibacter sp.]|nr:RagB/SusD family nutrient uptake outer membrane protein [Flavisolibacter sp.]
MKNIKTSSLACVMLLLCITSCKKEWLNTAPTDQVDQSTVFSTTTNAMIALNGIHRRMWTQYFNQDEAGQGSINIYMDVLGEDLINNSTASGAFYNSGYRWQAHRNANSTVPYFVYHFYYYIISNANALINNIDNASGPESDKKIIKGQALAYRAWAHFMLVQLFAKRYDATTKPNNQPGVPLMLTNTTTGQPRATVEEVYTQINKDLDDAITNLVGYIRPAKSHINSNVAKGIKARVALTMQDWATAAKFASEARQGFTLMSRDQYLAGFNDASNPEWMWASIIPVDQGTFFFSFFAFMASNFSSNATRTNPRSINKNLYDAIPATDVRKQLWSSTGVTPPASGTRFPYTSNKFRVKDPNVSVGDVVYMRAAEMYLIEAEANARSGKNTEAQDLLMTLVKSRDPDHVKSTKTEQALINEILLQRRIELWGEGFRFLDLKRTNSPLDRTGANHNAAIAVTLTVPAGDVQWEWLFPQEEINANPAIVQNPL